MPAPPSILNCGQYSSVLTQQDMTRNWEDVLLAARPLLSFLAFFDKPYIGNLKNHRVIFDLNEAIECSTNDSEDRYEDWQNLLESITPAWPEMPREIERNILKVLDQMAGKCFSCVSDSALFNNMQGDIARLLHCYAYGTVPQLWKAVQQVYLDGGIPCGWEGRYPEGRILVFSAQRSR